MIIVALTFSFTLFCRIFTDHKEILKELSDDILSYCGHAQNYLLTERNLKITVY